MGSWIWEKRKEGKKNPPTIGAQKKREKKMDRRRISLPQDDARYQQVVRTLHEDDTPRFSTSDDLRRKRRLIAITAQDVYGVNLELKEASSSLTSDMRDHAQTLKPVHPHLDFETRPNETHVVLVLHNLRDFEPVEQSFKRRFGAGVCEFQKKQNGYSRDKTDLLVLIPIDWQNRQRHFTWTQIGQLICLLLLILAILLRWRWSL
jgi:hypothetical protein